MTKRNDERTAAKRTTRGRKLLAVALLAAALGGAFAYQRFDSSALEQVLSESTRRQPYAFSWPAGTVYTYALDWTARQSSRVAQQGQDGKSEQAEIGGELALRSQLVLRSYGMSGGAFVLGLSLKTPHTFRWQVLGQDVIAKDKLATLVEGREAFLLIDARGHVQRTFFAKDTAPEFQSFVQWLLPHLQVSLPHDDTAWAAGHWQTREDTLHGEASVEYAVQADEPLVLRRARPRYTSLRTADVSEVKQASNDVAAVECAPAGHLTSVSSHVKLAIADAASTKLVLDESLELKLESVAKGPLLEPPDSRSELFRGLAMAEAPGSEGAEHQALLNRVGDLTVGDMVSNVLEFANSGRMGNKWLWQATGLLELHPEAAAELAAIFAHEDLSDTGRSMILDLLSSASTKESQAALRQLLETPVAKADATQHALYFNRVALVEADADTADFAAKQFEAHRKDDVDPMRIATSFALGSVAGARAAQGDLAGARALNDQLVEGLEQATSREEKAVLLRSMGNAGLEENVPTLVEHTRDESIDVRAAAADALRKNHTEQTTEALLALLKDPEWKVQQAALASLSKYDLTVDEVRRIEALLVAGVVGSRNDPLLVTVLGKNSSPEHPYQAGFAQLLARNVENGQLAARIRAITRRNGVLL